MSGGESLNCTFSISSSTLDVLYQSSVRSCLVAYLLHYLYHQHSRTDPLMLMHTLTQSLSVCVFVHVCARLKSSSMIWSKTNLPAFDCCFSVCLDVDFGFSPIWSYFGKSSDAEVALSSEMYCELL